MYIYIYIFSTSQTNKLDGISIPQGVRMAPLRLESAVRPMPGTNGRPHLTL